MKEYPVTNAYPDEVEKLKSDFNERLQVTFLIDDILTEYGYHLGIKVVKGVPEIDLIKCDCQSI